MGLVRIVYSHCSCSRSLRALRRASRSVGFAATMVAGISKATASRQIRNRMETPKKNLLAQQQTSRTEAFLLDDHASGGLSGPGKSFARIGAGAPQSGAHTLAHRAAVSGSVHGARRRLGNAPRGGCLLQQRPER